MSDATNNTHRRIRLPVAVAMGLVALAGLVTTGDAQHALDANLRLGSGGYNRPLPRSGYARRGAYTVGSAKPIYTVRRDGTMAYNPHSAFAPRGSYQPTGRYHPGVTGSSSWHRRFRYGGW